LSQSQRDKSEIKKVEGTIMNRDFEFKQLLRAYRKGIITEATFEQEMASLENGSGPSANGGGFTVFGKTYGSEREALLNVLDLIRAGEESAGKAIPKWVEACKTDCIRSGLKMIAEREAYHGRVFAQRLQEIGGECRADISGELRDYLAYIADPKVADLDKLHRAASFVRDPKEVLRVLNEFADMIKDDVQTKEMIRLFAEDECSSATWLNQSCEILTKLAKESRPAANA
jgi:hypothetical protein